MEAHWGEYCLSTDPARLQFEVIYEFLANESYWARGIPRETLQKQMENSTLHFGLYHGDSQVGYAQVLTNYVSFAYLGNVFVLEAHRGRGLSKWLMQGVMGHPDLQHIRRWLLATRDAHDLYRQFGFTELDKPELFMHKYDDEAYRR